jgi:hypothetical protein
MADNNQFNGSDHTSAQSGNGAVELTEFDRQEGGGIFHSYFVLLAMRYRRLLVSVCVSSMVLVFCLTFFVMHRKYEATAIIRPLGQNQNGLTGLLQGTGLSNMADMSGTGIDSDIGTNIHDPDELVGILTSYTFTTAMIEAENLEPKLGGRTLWTMLTPFLNHEKQGSLWGYYRLMSAAFDCDNSVRTGNITLTYVDKDPEFAKYVLQLYIDRLRGQLRGHDVRYCKDAARALQESAATVTDPMLRDDLYDLAARQIKKVGTAEANADFAFTVIENPYVSPYSVRPWIVIDTLAAGVVFPLFVFLVLVVRDWVPRMRKDLQTAVSESKEMPDSIALSFRNRRPPRPEDDRPYPLV